VHSAVYDQFLARAEDLIRMYVPGDPLKPGTNLGPLTLPDTPGMLSERMMSAIESGAHIVVGGTTAEDLEGYGRFFNATLIVDCDECMEIF
jgi:acyl-CoA reductase-like NAD-dependent aldehyde dehydrogenase